MCEQCSYWVIVRAAVTHFQWPCKGKNSSVADLSSKWNKLSCKQHPPSMFVLTNLPVEFSWHSSFSLFTQLCSLFLGWLRFRIWCDPRNSFGKYHIEIPTYIMTFCPKSAAFNRADSQVCPCTASKPVLKVVSKGPIKPMMQKNTCSRKASSL